MKPKRSNRQPCSSGESMERQRLVPSQSHPLNLSQVSPVTYSNDILSYIVFICVYAFRLSRWCLHLRSTRQFPTATPLCAGSRRFLRLLTTTSLKCLRWPLRLPQGPLCTVILHLLRCPQPLRPWSSFWAEVTAIHLHPMQQHTPPPPEETRPVARSL